MNTIASERKDALTKDTPSESPDRPQTTAPISSDAASSSRPVVSATSVRRTSGSVIGDASHDSTGGGRPNNRDAPAAVSTSARRTAACDRAAHTVATGEDTRPGQCRPSAAATARQIANASRCAPSDRPASALTAVQPEVIAAPSDRASSLITATRLAATPRSIAGSRATRKSRRVGLAIGSIVRLGASRSGGEVDAGSESSSDCSVKPAGSGASPVPAG